MAAKPGITVPRLVAISFKNPTMSPVPYLRRQSVQRAEEIRLRHRLAAVELAGEKAAGLGQPIGHAVAQREAKIALQTVDLRGRIGQQVLIGEPAARQMAGMALGGDEIGEPEQHGMGAGEIVLALLAGRDRPWRAAHMDDMRLVAGLRDRALIKREQAAKMRMFQAPERIRLKAATQDLIQL